MPKQFHHAGPIRTLATVGALALPLLWGGCEGSATQTTNGGAVEGKLVDAQGNPVYGVEVRAFALGAIGTPGGQGVSAARALTGRDGSYRLTGLGADSYNIFGRQADGAKGVLIPGVVFAAADTNLGIDTLVAPGSITGRVTVEDRPAAEVFCYIPGSSLAVISDSGGHFTLPALPPGTYSLKLAGHDLESRVLPGIAVGSDSVTVLAPVAMLFDSRLAPAVPRGFTATMLDTALTLPRLAWLPPASSDIIEYRIYADYYLPGDTSAPLRSDSLSHRGSELLASPLAYEDPFAYAVFLDRSFRGRDSVLAVYRLSAVDVRGNLSLRPSDPDSLLIVRQPWMKAGMQLTERASLPGGPGCSDTLNFRITMTDFLADSLDFSWNLEFYRGAAATGQYNGKYYDEDGIVHTAIRTDSLSWWHGIHGLTLGGKPDSVLATARAAIRHRGQYDDRRMHMGFKLDSAGCYRAAGPAYDPKIY